MKCRQLSVCCRMAAVLMGLGLFGAWLAVARPEGEPARSAVPRRYTTDAWIAAADRAFGGKRPARKPGGLIFPVVDEAGKVRPDGRGISRMAAVMATFAPVR